MAFALVLAVAAGLEAEPEATNKGWVPATAPPLTAWAKAGARGWRVCEGLNRRALSARVSGSIRGRSAQEALWSERAKVCPHAPEVLVLAAQQEILNAAAAGWLPETNVGFDEVVAAHREHIERALELLDRAIVEAHRRGDPEPFEALYFRAYASAAKGDFAGAAGDLVQAELLGDVEAWRAQRMLSVALLLGGDLEASLQAAQLAMLGAPSDDQMISMYIYAFVLDRAGAPASAQALFRQLRRLSGSGGARRAVESFLPIHERLFLRAVDHQANGERTNAMRLWDAYLSRPEPEEADMELARRHKAEL